VGHCLTQNRITIRATATRDRAAARTRRHRGCEKTAGIPLTLVRATPFSIHRYDPDGLVILRMAGHGKADISDFLRHIVADPFPALIFGAVLPVETINAA